MFWIFSPKHMKQTSPSNISQYCCNITLSFTPTHARWWLWDFMTTIFPLSFGVCLDWQSMYTITKFCSQYIIHHSMAFNKRYIFKTVWDYNNFKMCFCIFRNIMHITLIDHIQKYWLKWFTEFLVYWALNCPPCSCCHLQYSSES